ncbi:hypothetical protein VT03_10025 [Planctomyces sp. SH-PL14]|nr:hypothetical protein VT03_10025 [Planctomyces sp. SH-PL14]
MIEVIAEPTRGQEAAVRIVSHAVPDTREFETLPSTVPLVVKQRDPGWHPPTCRSLPGGCSFSMPKALAVQLAVMLNRAEMARYDTKNPSDGSTNWYVVAISKSGFTVVKILVLDWWPESPFDLPPDAWPMTFANVAARCASQEFNRRQMANGRVPAYWCVSIKRISAADLIASEGFEWKGGAA